MNPINVSPPSAPNDVVTPVGLRSLHWAIAFLQRHALVILAVMLLVAIPLLASTFRIGLYAKYLSFGFCAVGLALCWGYGGILSLGQ